MALDFLETRSEKSLHSNNQKREPQSKKSYF